MKITIKKCQCGDEGCNSYRFPQAGPEGMFDKEDAEIIRDRVNYYLDFFNLVYEVATRPLTTLEDVNAEMLRQEINRTILNCRDVMKKVDRLKQ